MLGLIGMPPAGTTIKPPMRIERIVKGRHDGALHRCAAAKAPTSPTKFCNGRANRCGNDETAILPADSIH
jgi:hypothetical protein